MDERRAGVAEKLVSLCPAPFRGFMRPMVDQALTNMRDDEISGLVADIETVRAYAEAGDSDGITAIAEKYGANNAVVQTYLPMLIGSAE